MLARIFLCTVLCTCSLTVLAQDGPWTVLETDNRGFGVFSSQRSRDTLDIIVQIMENMHHVAVNPTSGEILEDPISFLGGVEAPPELYDMVSTDSLWIAAIYTRNEPTAPPSYQIWLQWGSDVRRGMSRIHEQTHYGGSGTCGSWPEHFRLTRGGTDTVWCSFVDHWYCPDEDPQSGFDAVVGFYLLTEDTFQIVQQQHGFGAADVWVIPTPADTLLNAVLGLSGTICFSAVHGSQPLCEEGISVDCDPARPVALLARSDQGVLVLSRTSGVNPTAPARLFEANLVDGTCNELFTLYREPAAGNANARHGIAWLSIEGQAILLTRIDTNGAISLPEGLIYQGSGEWEIRDADVTIRDDGRVVVVWSERLDTETDCTRVKLMSLGWDTPLAADAREHAAQPSSLKLSAFPNPFNGELRIEYELAHAQEISLSVFDVLGRQVDVIYSGRVDAGAHSAVWNPEGASGIYLVRLSTSEASTTQKVLFMK